MKYKLGDLILYKDKGILKSIGSVVDRRLYGKEEFYTISWNPPRKFQGRIDLVEITHLSEKSVDYYRKDYIKEFGSD